MKNLLLSLAVTAGLLGLVEVVMRCFDWERPGEAAPNAAEAAMFVADSAVGYHLWPDTRTCMRYPPQSHRVVSVVSNSAGFADPRELVADDPRPRIMVLGDSFTFGIGVEPGDRFTSVLEDREPRWRVDNFGMPGWGLDLMVRTLERHGPEVRPAVVVLAFYTDDFRRLSARYAGVGFPYRKFAVRGGRLVDVPFPVQGFWGRLRLVNLARRALTRANDFFALNEMLIDRFDRGVRQLGAKPVVLFLPGRSDTPVDRERRARLARWAAARGIPFRDLTEAIHGAGVENTYIAGNWHWNERGHRIAALALRDLLANEVLTGVGPEPVAPPPAQRPETWRGYCRDGGRTDLVPRAGGT